MKRKTWFLLCWFGLWTCDWSWARPNVFIAISDDQSWIHCSAYGSQMVQTPHFERVAREGVLMTQAFAPSPGCSPSRAAFLTGRYPWKIQHAGTHASYFHPQYVTFPDRLAAVGHVGKGWGPGDFKTLGREHNPAGPKMPGGSGYAAGFAHFLENVRQPDQLFCFWFGSSDPHRPFRPGAGLASGKRLEDAEVPSFLPDTPEVRSDLLDYAFEKWSALIRTWERCSVCWKTPGSWTTRSFW